MCGIAGQLNFSAPPITSDVRSLADGIRHRGPDDFGLWVSDNRECVLGHTRLSVVDLSAMGHQPMVDISTGNSITFNGEIYNFKALRKECETNGDEFFSNSDTEVILALYRRYGVQCLSKLRGMFAFALWDEHRKRLFIARDRVGKKPLNYSVSAGGIVFCSEIDPLSRHPAIDDKIDEEALDLYLQLQYIPSPRTIYRHIRKLPPAHFALIDKQGIRIERYWDVDYRQKTVITESDAIDGLEEKLSEAIRLRMISDVPLGALLSGGVDSSIIVALMAKQASEPVRTYSVGFSETAFNELPYAERAARTCGTLHQAEILNGNVAELLPTLVRHYGEPFADSSAIPSFFVCRSARKNVTVALNGDGGDELLGGYSRYSLNPVQIFTSRIFREFGSTPSRTNISAALATAPGIMGKAGRKVMTEYLWPEMRSLVMYSSAWNEAQRARLMGRTGPSGTVINWHTENFQSARAHASNATERMLYYDNRTYLEGDLLVKMDIASMHCGLETRSPLLDHEVIEYCAALPLNLKVRNGIGKYLLKRLAERYFEPELIHRPKKGFAIPKADWLRGPLRETMENVIRNPHAMEPLDSNYAGRFLDEFLHHKIDHSSRLWALLMFGLWRLQATKLS